MKNRLLTLGFCALFAVGLAQPLAAPSALMPLTSLQRQALVDQFNNNGRGQILWAEYYSYGPVDRAYWLGRAEQSLADAWVLEHYAAALPATAERSLAAAAETDSR